MTENEAQTERPTLTNNETELICALGMLLRSSCDILNIGASADSERRMVFCIPPGIYLEFSGAINGAMETLRKIGGSHDR